MKKFDRRLSLDASGRVLAFVLAGLLVLFALFYAASEAGAQTPADDQYGSPTAVGVAEGAADLGSDTGVVGSFGTGSAGEVEDDGTSSSAAASGTSDPSGDPEGVLASVLPSTGGSSVFLVGLAALALIGTGIIVFRNRFARD